MTFDGATFAVMVWEWSDLASVLAVPIAFEVDALRVVAIAVVIACWWSPRLHSVDAPAEVTAVAVMLVGLKA